MKQELDCTHLDALIVSGDIANISVAEEYDAAKAFFDLVYKEFDVGPDQLVLVPGNHDLNWELSKKKGYKLTYKEDCGDKVADLEEMGEKKWGRATVSYC